MMILPITAPERSSSASLGSCAGRLRERHAGAEQHAQK